MWKGIIHQVHWEPTDKCNSGCPMCPRYTSDGFESTFLANAEWTLDAFIKSWPVDFLKDLEKILSCGNFGDPCACREFVDIYEYCREINPNIQLACNTNGSLRNTDWWYRLGKVIGRNRGDYCTFSLDGLEDTNHLYRRNTNWKKIMENVQAFIDAGGTAHWDYIVFEHNEHQVDEAKELAKKMGFKNFNIKKTTRWRNYIRNQGVYPVLHKGKHLYNLMQPKQERFKHNFEDTILFQDQKNQSFKSDDLFYNRVGESNTDQRWINGKWESIDLNTLSIKCRSVAGERKYHKNEIFISASGHVAPCCFLGSEPFVNPNNPNVDKNYLDLISIQGGLDKLDIHKNNLYDILQLDIFQKYIPDTWKENGNRTMRPLKCGQCCGVEFNALDYGELGNKEGSDLG